jgi:hypothetical protein
MKASAAEVLSKIPDFDEFMSLTKEIADLLYSKLALEAKIKAKETENYKTVSTDKSYFQGDKPPSSAYIENAYKYSGLNGELVPMRLDLAKVSADLELKRLQLDVWKNMIEVWRSLSASERSSTV